jgi:lipopolysaccharide/colanic/teichoic acid biosynthesis glycosyltransferase
MGSATLHSTKLDSATEAMLLLRSRRGTDAVCRALDLGVALLLLVPLLPLMLAIAILIRRESSGPVLFRQIRIGRDRKPFTVNKFRTMKHGASSDIHRTFVLGLISGERPPKEEGKPRFKLFDDDRITGVVGHLLRRTSLDELPQLWNVVRGEMSLVGPRPSIPYEVDHYPADWLARFAVKPGISGLWQVSGRSELTLSEMVQLDLDYVKRRSLRLNVWILLRTVPAVLTLRGAS